MDGPPPSDPSTLEQSSDNQPSQESSVPPKAPVSNPNAAPSPAPLLLTSNTVAPPTKQPHNLLSSTHARGSSLAASASQANPAATTNQNELFSLDFSAPAIITSSETPKKDVKQDILSLFSANPVPVAQSIMVQQNQQSLVGVGGPAMWGADSWSTPVSNPSQGIPDNNVWATSGPAASTNTQYNANLSSQNIWGGPTSFQSPANTSEQFGAPAKPAPKDDAFGDLWGSFK